MYGVTITELIQKMNLRNMAPEIDTDKIVLECADVNRPALQLTGFFDHFDHDRVQLIGSVEYAYMMNMEPNTKVEIYAKLLSCEIPCLIYCRGNTPDDIMQNMCRRYQVPLLVTEESTCGMMAKIITWISAQLAPMISVHGVLVDVYGEGVMMMGESGIGKSEAALELIRRGHRLVTDDVVEIRRINEDTLIGSAPDITKHFIELRGIGIIDAKALFGVESVKETQQIDMVIRLEEWNNKREYDRLGLQDHYMKFLENKVVCYSVPIRPGRNVAVIVESATINHRQKKMGYNAAQELYNRVQANFGKAVLRG